MPTLPRPLPRRLPGLLVVLLVLLGPGMSTGRLQGQSGPVQLAVDPRSGAPELRIGGVLEETRFREALEEGLPLRIRVQAELWRDGFFDSQEGRGEWRATVLHDPLARTYRFRTGEASTDLVLGSLEQLRAAVLQSFTLPLRPGRRGRYYYLATLEVETFSLSDLEELQRWLRGDLAPGIAGEGGGVDGALTRGVGRLLQRALGLPTLRIRLQSPFFDFPSTPEGSEGVEAAEWPGDRRPRLDLAGTTPHTSAAGHHPQEREGDPVILRRQVIRPPG